MEQRDLELIHRYIASDDVLASLYKEHQDYEKELEDLEDKSYRTQEEELRLKQLKKKKLVGRDRIEFILRKYRAAQKKD